jgi:hypothetical protein
MVIRRALLLSWLLAGFCIPAMAVSVIPDTRVYLETTETLIGKKDQVEVGQVVQCRIWRDVEIDGQVVIAAGTPASAKVDSLTKRKIAGIKGKMSLAALETTTVDGQTVQLSGGYNKEGKGRVALSASLSALVAWPLIFIPGKAAELGTGTVFDTYTMQALNVHVDEPARRSAPRTIDLSGVVDDFSAEVLYDRLEADEKPKVFYFEITAAPTAPNAYVIDRINGSTVDAIELDTLSTDRSDSRSTSLATAEIKPLAKQFKRGINTFEIAYGEGSQRVSTEVVLDIQF